MSLGVNTNDTPEGGIERYESYIHMENNYIVNPRNKILLIRKNEYLCALQFHSFHSIDKEFGSCEVGTPTVHHGEYSWFYTLSKTGKFTGSYFESGRKKVKNRFTKGFGANNHIDECGDLPLVWTYPTGFQQIPKKGWPVKFDFEYAPTRWERIEEVDANDPSLIWYGPNKEIPEKWIHVDDLPPKNLKKKPSSPNEQ